MTNRTRKNPHKWNAVRQHEDKHGFKVWWKGVKRDGIKAFYRHPHHYVVAAIISLVLYIIGIYEVSAHTTNWMYAVLENVTTVLSD